MDRRQSQDLDKERIHILRHSLGLDESGHGREYRNYCECLPACSAIASLVADGLMYAGYRINQGQDQYFHVTEAGKQEALRNVEPLPKLTRSQRRYREFLNADPSCSFGEWLKWRANQ
jgi:hypothetical protein